MSEKLAEFVQKAEERSVEKRRIVQHKKLDRLVNKVKMLISQGELNEAQRL